MTGICGGGGSVTSKRGAAVLSRRAGGAGGDGGEGVRSIPGEVFDLTVHFYEKLQAGHGIELSYTWVKQAPQGVGLVGADGNVGRIINGGRGGHCRGCCCTTTAAVPRVPRTNAGTL